MSGTSFLLLHSSSIKNGAPYIHAYIYITFTHYVAISFAGILMFVCQCMVGGCSRQNAMYLLASTGSRTSAQGPVEFKCAFLHQTFNDKTPGHIVVLRSHRTADYCTRSGSIPSTYPPTPPVGVIGPWTRERL